MKEALLMGANEAYDAYHVTRAWLRDNAQQGRIRRMETHGRTRDGKYYVKYLYYVEDIERVLGEFSSRSQFHARRAPRHRDFDERW